MRCMMRSMAPVIFLLVGAVLAVGVAGCEDRYPRYHRERDLRVVSLSPAVTQMIVDLDQADLLVGVGANDPAAPDGLPVLGLYPGIDYEAVVAVQPTDIFLQPPDGVAPDRLLALSGRHGWRIHVYRFDTVRDVLDVLYDPGASNQFKQIGGALGVPLTAGELAARIQEQLETLATLTAGQKPPRVLLLHSLEPPAAVGPGTFLNELLVYANGVNVMITAAADYPALDRETIVELKPDVIVVLGAAAPDELPPLLRGLEIPAVQNQRIAYLDDPLALLPSSSMPRIAARLVQCLHPDLADQVDPIMNHDDAR